MIDTKDERQQLLDRIDELEAQAAAMREALLGARLQTTGAFSEGTKQVVFDLIDNALSPDAGCKVLAVLAAARRIYAVDRVMYSHDGMDEAVTAVSKAIEDYDGHR